MRAKWLILGSLSTLWGCDLADHRAFHDPVLKLQQADFENITKKPEDSLKERPFYPKPPAPSPLPFLTAAMRKEVSLTVCGEIPLQRIFMELGAQANVGIALNPAMAPGRMNLTYSAQKVPFIEVVRDLCALTNHRFQIQGNRVLVEPDIPYLMTYNIQFLSNTRKNETRISIATDVFSPLESKNRADNGSNSILQGTSLIDFWAELEQNLRLFLGVTKGPASYSLHKQGGLLTIVGTAKQHEQISNYLMKLKEATATQVIIEAKIIEVTLNQAYQTGINWNQLGGMVHVAAPLAFSLPHQASTDGVAFSLEHAKFSTILNLVKKFGTVRTLSNPRLTVMNNQPAMLKVATNEVFFHLEFERLFQGDGKPDIETVSSDPMTVPIGLVMVVQPSVNLQTGEITMTLRPTVSRVQKEVEDPAVSMKSHQKVKSTVPVVQVRELDSVLKIKSGQVVIMGGLMEDRAGSTTASVPGIDTLPFLGELAKGKEDERHVTELVIFLTAHIAEDPYIHEADARIYNVYTEDPRPLRLK